MSMVDVIEGYDIILPCAVETLLDNQEIWDFWVNYTYNEGVIVDLDKIPFLQAFIIQTFKMDQQVTKEIRGNNG